MLRLFAAMPIMALAYVLILQPLMDKVLPEALDGQVIWPLLFVLTVALFFICRRQTSVAMLRQEPVVLLAALLALCGASALWAFNPEIAFKRWWLALIVATVAILPFSLRISSRDILDDIFKCFTVAMFISAIFVLTTPPVIDRDGIVFGHFGYFFHKQYLGFCASTAILISSYFILTKRRPLTALAACMTAIWVIVESKSKSSLGFLFLAPLLAGVVFLARRYLGVPIAVGAAAIPISYNLLALTISNLSSRIALSLYGDPTFTGRTLIWDFIEGQAALRPWFGWGFHSFWHVPGSPVLSAPGFVKDMPSGHSGYLDLRLENGYVGLALFLVFVALVLHRLERVYLFRPDRCFAFLTIFAYVLIMNLMETIWFIAFDALWITFLILAGSLIRETAVAPKPAPAPRRINRFNNYARPNVRRT